MIPILPMHRGDRGLDSVQESSLAMLPFVGAFLLLLLLVGLAELLLWRSGRLALPALGNRSSAPEQEARRILAERFARGDISSDDFLERASILNWTPGGDSMPDDRRRPKRS